MNLNELRDKSYKNACEHGFHDQELSNEHCLCLVISELMEAVEADRKCKVFKGVVAFEREFNRYPALVEESRRFKCAFEKCVKDTVPDELADAVIRLLDLCGLRKIELENDCLDDEVLEEYSSIFIDKTITESIFNITKSLIDRDIVYSFIKIFGLAKHLNIDLLWHIEQKMKYNELREKMHGKKY
jgi:hypothetical protein